MQNHQISLKDATSVKHKLAETMPFNVRMFRGQLSKKDYLSYLQQQLAIFETIENIGIPHENLKRVANVKLDIEELIQEGHSPSDILDSTIEYQNHLKNKSISFCCLYNNQKQIHQHNNKYQFQHCSRKCY